MVAFFKLRTRVYDLLFHRHDALLKLIDVDGGAPSPFARQAYSPGQFGQAILELLGAWRHAGAALLSREQVGVQCSG